MLLRLTGKRAAGSAAAAEQQGSTRYAWVLLPLPLPLLLVLVAARVGLPSASLPLTCLPPGALGPAGGQHAAGAEGRVAPQSVDPDQSCASLPARAGPGGA